jgi:hypothetical protein
MRPRSYTVPLAALGTTLFFLVAAIVVIVAGRAGAGAGSCVVGTWNVIRHEEKVPLGDSLGSVTMIGGRDGATLTLRANGTGVTDYGESGAQYYGKVGDKVVRLEVTGQVTFRYVAEGGTATLSDLDVNALGQAFVDGEQVGEAEPLQPTSASTYTCNDDELVETSGQARITYERAG